MGVASARRNVPADRIRVPSRPRAGRADDGRLLGEGRRGIMPGIRNAGWLAGPYKGRTHPVHVALDADIALPGDRPSGRATPTRGREAAFQSLS